VITFPFLLVVVPAVLVRSADKGYYSSIVFPQKKKCMFKL
jgi:hypothetical protein